MNWRWLFSSDDAPDQPIVVPEEERVIAPDTFFGDIMLLIKSDPGGWKFESPTLRTTTAKYETSILVVLDINDDCTVLIDGSHYPLHPDNIRAIGRALHELQQASRDEQLAAMEAKVARAAKPFKDA